MATKKRRQSPDEIWSVKAQVRARDGKCVKCGVSNSEYLETTGFSLDVHRVTPASLYTVEGCVSLCKECHGSEPKSPPGEGDDPHRSSRFIRLPEWLHEGLKRVATRHRRNMTKIVRDVLEKGLREMGEDFPRDAPA